MVKRSRKTQKKSRKTKRRRSRRVQRGGDISGMNIPEAAVFANPMKVGKEAGGVESESG
jgi:hypothetical protein